MIYIFLTIFMVILTILTPKFIDAKHALIKSKIDPDGDDAFAGSTRRKVEIVIGRSVFAILALFFVLSTSIISIPADKIGVVQKLYGVTNLKDGHIIATNGETGYQAEIIQPGTFRISPFFNVINSVIILPIVTVPNGFYGRIVAIDGAPLGEGEIMAPAWTDAEFAKFLDAEYFLKNGGRKGLQLSILTPGNYPINLAQFNVKIGYAVNGKDSTKSGDDVYDIRGLTQDQTPLNTSIIRIPAGSVGVVRSSVQDPGVKCEKTKKTTIDAAAGTATDGLAAELVPEGCKGIWSTSLAPNDYYKNRDAYEVTEVSTRVTTIEFKGGFSRRYIDLKIDSRGDFTQTEHTVNFPDISDDRAINTKVEGWEIPQELRAIVQIPPENAPIVVAAVGGQKEVDQRIVIPSIRSHVRNVFGSEIVVTHPDENGKPVSSRRQTRVLDTVEQRPVLEEEILRRAKIDGSRAGVDIKEIRLGESAIPPELLLARQREQLATQLKSAFDQERIAQTQRQQTEFARATADKQSDVVTAEIGVQTAKLRQDQRQAEGRAERLYLEEQAAGQTAQANVLGKDAVMRLQMFNNVIDLLKAKPEIIGNIKLPTTYVSGGAGVDGAAAIFGQVFGAAQAAQTQAQPNAK